MNMNMKYFMNLNCEVNIHSNIHYLHHRNSLKMNIFT